ncbi:hypothetical protein [Ilyobacter polytropus]|uniref:Uncharacterized protein n=1 Tax=Ilyobacter polytropus (strain ATCC 51220 / DSM 2926 / LMG 16218 / CuHBu1) TaxID=572544 RepID=E3H7R2_ILYPC|nr:hypothetical protein [Ilyobacter polytropus]ADO82644.1 hypothetical protein Ilyop_0858 [Ilyobacter polytropus DSM 2926]
MKFVKFDNSLVRTDAIIVLRIKFRNSFKESVWNVEIFMEDILLEDEKNYFFESYKSKEEAKERLEEIVAKIGIEVI